MKIFLNLSNVTKSLIFIFMLAISPFLKYKARIIMLGEYDEAYSILNNYHTILFSIIPLALIGILILPLILIVSGNSKYILSSSGIKYLFFFILGNSAIIAVLGLVSVFFPFIMMIIPLILAGIIIHRYNFLLVDKFVEINSTNVTSFIKFIAFALSFMIFLPNIWF